MTALPQTIRALEEALDDEYKARATYRAVIDAIGPVTPFVNIIGSESRHITALLALFEKYGLEAPPDSWAGRVKPPTSLADACAEGVAAEIENEGMYDRLLADVEEADVREVFERLQWASQNNHRPAFQRCLDRESGITKGGNGKGRRRRHGRT